MQYIHTLEYYLVIKSYGIVIHATIFMNFETMMLSESSQSQNARQYVNCPEWVNLQRQEVFSWWLSGKEFTCNAGDPVSIPGSGRSPGEGHGNPLQYSCLENPVDSGALRATVHGVSKSRTQLKWLDTHTHTHTHTQSPSVPRLLLVSGCWCAQGSVLGLLVSFYTFSW